MIAIFSPLIRNVLSWWRIRIWGIHRIKLQRMSRQWERDGHRRAFVLTMNGKTAHCRQFEQYWLLLLAGY